MNTLKIPTRNPILLSAALATTTTSRSSFLLLLLNKNLKELNLLIQAASHHPLPAKVVIDRHDWLLEGVDALEELELVGVVAAGAAVSADADEGQEVGVGDHDEFVGVEGHEAEFFDDVGEGEVGHKPTRPLLPLLLALVTTPLTLPHLPLIDMPQLQLLVLPGTHNIARLPRHKLHLLDVVGVRALADEERAVAALDVVVLPGCLVGAGDEGALGG